MSFNNTSAQKIFEVNGLLEAIPQQFNTAKNALIKGDYFEYRKKLDTAIISLEKATIRARALANTSYKARGDSHSYENLMSDVAMFAHQIYINISTDNICSIKLPCLLPRWQTQGKVVLTEPLNQALRDYQNKRGKLPKYTKMVMVIVNMVSENVDETRVRDNDNYEYKQVVNTLAYWFINDDGWKYINQFNSTKRSQNDYTQIYLVPSEIFPAWMSKNTNKIW